MERARVTAARWERPARGRRWGALLAALLMQVVAVSLLWMDHGWRLRGGREPPRLTEVRLLPPTHPRERPSPASLARPEPARRPDAPRLPSPILVAVPEVTITASLPPATVQTAAAPASAASSPDRSRAPLNLALPKAAMQADPHTRMAEQIRNDERAHTAPRTVESALADAAGTLPIVTSVSTSGTGSKLVRQGSKCVRVYENRIAALNPTDDRLKDAPSVSSSCYNK